jgi:cell wall-associated NlpC family hydrolase
MIRGRKTVGALALAGIALWLAKQPARQDAATEQTTFEPAQSPPPPVPAAQARPRWRRRAALALAYTTLFFAGGAVVAGAGNQLVQIDPQSTDAAAVTTDATSTDTTTAADATTTDDMTTTDPTTTDPTTTTDSTTTTDVTTTTDDATTTTDPTTTSETTPTDTTDDGLLQLPDPSEAAPPVAADAGTPAAPPTPTRTSRPRPSKQAQVRVAATAIPSPFPVLRFDPQEWLVAHAGTPAGAAAVTIAEQYVGVPYRWGGNTPSTGFDCSGLTQYVYAQLGVWLPHYAASQFLAYPRVDPTQLEPGDLVFFEPKPDGPGHVAIYVGGDEIVEAPHTGADVRLGSLSGAAASLGFLGAVRPGAAAATPATLLVQLLPLGTAASSPAGRVAHAE